MGKEYCLITTCKNCEATIEIKTKGNPLPLRFDSIEAAMQAKKAYESGKGFLSSYGLIVNKQSAPLPDYVECRECGIIANRTDLSYFVQRFPAPL